LFTSLTERIYCGGANVTDLLKLNIKVSPMSYGRRLSGIIAACLLSVGLITGSAMAQQQGGKPPATPVKVDAVLLGPFSQTIPLIGRFIARQHGDVATRVSGSVKEIAVDVGDRVTKGDVVASLVKDRLEWQRSLQRAEVSNYTAQVDTAKAHISQIQKSMDRVSSLKNSPAFSQARLDDKEQEILVARSQLVEAEASLRKARANLRLTEIDVQDAKILAPYDGVVSRKHTSAGAYLNVGSKVVTLIDDQTLEIEADVPSARVNGLKPGTEVDILFGEGNHLKAGVRAIVPDENPLTRTRAVRFTPELAPSQNGLAANQTVTLFLPYGEKKNVLSVHKDAILNRRGKTLVIVPANGLVTFRPVKLGQAVGNRFVVLEGLQDGEMVVVRGNERLRPKQAISYEGQPARKETQPSAEGSANTKSEG
jgi:RND family efflux transporter MFP subunit